MGSGKAITLCAIVVALTAQLASCNDKEVQQVDAPQEKAQVNYLANDTKEAKYTPPIIKNIKHFIKDVDLPSKLEALLESSSESSTYSAAKLIEASLPKLLQCIKDDPFDDPYDDFEFPKELSWKGCYEQWGDFTDEHGEIISVIFEYYPNKNEIKIEFNDEGRNVHTRNVRAIYNLNDGKLDITRFGYDETAGKFITEVPVDIGRLKKRYAQILKWLYERLTIACENNPYANVATTVEEFEEEVKRTTKPTIVMTTASWCAPCRYFRRWYFNKFLKDNKDKYDLIVADMDPNHNSLVETNKELERYFKNRFGISGGSLPTLFFLDKDHKHIGSYTDGNSDEFVSAVRDILKDAKQDDTKAYEGIF